VPKVEHRVEEIQGESQLFNNSQLRYFKNEMLQRKKTQVPCRLQRSSSASPPALHCSMTPTMKRRRRDPPFNHPQNKNNKKHHFPHMLFNVLAEHKCSR
jgi:hypothetical protein